MLVADSLYECEAKHGYILALILSILLFVCGIVLPFYKILVFLKKFLKKKCRNNNEEE